MLFTTEPYQTEYEKDPTPYFLNNLTERLCVLKRKYFFLIPQWKYN